MKIAYVCQPWDRMLPSQGSVTTSIGILTREIAVRMTDDYEVTIYSAADRGVLHKVVEQGGDISYRAIPGSSIENRLSLPLKLAYERLGARGDRHKPFFATRYYLAIFARQLANDLSEQGFDIIHVANFFQFVPPIRAKNPDAKILLHMNCSWLGQIDPELLRPAVEQSDLIVGCGTHLAEETVPSFPQQVDRFITIANGVDLRQFRKEREQPVAPPAPDAPLRILFVGRVSPEKGTHVAIEAFKKVRQQRSDVVLDIVGPLGSAPPDFLILLDRNPRVLDLMKYYGEDGKQDLYYDSLQKMIPPELKDDIIFHGTVPHEKLLDYYQCADVYINSSLSEAFPLPVGEAMASGVAVIAARVGGIPDMVIHGETGLLFEPDDADALAAELLELLADPQRRETLRTAASHRIETVYSWDRIADLFRDEYVKLMS